jgi:hypothetical protein
MIRKRASGTRFIMVCGNGHDHRPLRIVGLDEAPGMIEDRAKSAAADLDKASGCGVHTWRRVEIR